jgi:hypothetical protein
VRRTCGAAPRRVARRDVSRETGGAVSHWTGFDCRVFLARRAPDGRSRAARANRVRDAYA